MRRLVLFEGAPTIEQCYSSLDLDHQPDTSWHIVTLDFSPPHQPTLGAPRPASPASPAPRPAAQQPTIKPEATAPSAGGNPWDVTASQFQDAVEGSPVQDARAGAEPEEQPDSLELSRRRTRRRSSSSPEVERSEQEDEGEGVSRTSFMMPPPTQARSRYSAVFRAQHSQPVLQPPHDDVSFAFPPSAAFLDVSRDTTVNYTADDSYDPTYAEGASLGAPPHFAWKVYDLTALNQLRKKLVQASVRGAPSSKVSVLAAVNSFEQRDTAKSKLTEVTLIDDSGQHVKLAIWGAAGVEIGKVIQRADIIYVENVALKEYGGALQLSFSDRDSQLGICWRTHAVDVDDWAYRFHEGWRESLVEADEVLKQADWFSRRFG
ncbi:uncharacterized protein RHOBADRAFT_52927 [Rhodotorula graminis WP1]|uniref:Replication protein A OB domain-containing protein n=1 Tax=Rhodotorula graminis (strain WP1) TaxID=578459 RepID=A0A194S5Y8_RHOGW|nr:uncharacterized protein RHOBADRAFT_52927 [Rhodotorula graminis WP1]KPV75915.1 hypothetical protein RHOBADRAFT_52927 [Rhodotorula graminis WP1]